MTKQDIIKKLAELDALYNEQLYNRTMTEEALRKLRNKRDNLEKRLYK